MSKSICVFSASSNAIDINYFKFARKLGEEIARRKYTLIFGGGEVGLMGAVAAGVRKNGGAIVGVIPKALNQPGIAYRDADHLIETRDLRQRKAIMESRADAFFALPGGFGTLEESLEIITLKQLRLLDKPFVFLNVNNFYEPLIALFEYLYQERFAKQHFRQLYFFAKTIEEAFEYLDNYQPVELEAKWF
ncbi:MAG: TIGR00730 family Rossman fold protein [Calditrichaceae bacterium]|nr:TIGR00730 family Rossman fold protein [Calditrichia bacterium]NUQ41652.1 TIGR00730 family Rossman fold protein [Calditrichaceae bacterium]